MRAPPPASPDSAPTDAPTRASSGTAVSSPVVLFDGVCNLCNGAVTWILERDRRQRFRFASLQSDAARALLAQHVPDGQVPDSIVLLDRDGVHVRSEAALRIASSLGGVWSLLGAARILPRSLRDGIYAWIARNRYRWFGRRDHCMMPDPALAHRFLDSGA
jgi:predicted DCC family thiol-disulfide oxidoreductase YuxK